MSFCSIDFIFIFLPVFVLLHGIIKGKARNAVLFFGSLVFYCIGIAGHLGWLIILLLCAVINYLTGLAISDTEKNYRRGVLICGVVFNVAILLLFKYADALFAGFSSLALPGFNQGADMLPKILLPLGISFYTFKNLSYIHEVYRNKAEAEYSFIDYGAYLFMFPQIISGPIQTFSDMSGRLKKRSVTVEGISSGLSEFILGMGLKVIFANRLGGIWSGILVIGYESISTPLAWLGIISFSLQLYFDFFGYSLMAVGVGEMLGFKTPQNFNYPYISRSMTDFWRRWHMTLGSWFKENVYFPLGGSRCSKPKLVRNLFIVWVLTGIWHGGSLNFLIWGVGLFVLIAAEKFGWLDFIIKNKVLSHIYMFFAIIISWLLFKINNLRDIAVYLGRMFPLFSAPPEICYALDWVKYVKGLGVLIVVGLVFITPLPRKLYNKFKENKFITVPALLAIFWYSVYLVVCGGNDPFLYFQF